MKCKQQPVHVVRMYQDNLHTCLAYTCHYYKQISLFVIRHVDVGEETTKTLFDPLDLNEINRFI